MCGENEELIKELDVLKLVNKNSSPAFIWATRNDNAVPVRNSVLLAEKYDELGLDYSIHIFGKGQHGLSLADSTVYGSNDYLNNFTNSTTTWVRLSVEWLKEHNLYI